MTAADPYARFKFQDVDCPDCGEPLRLTERDVEQTVTCPICAAISEVGYDDATDGRGYFLKMIRRLHRTEPSGRCLGCRWWKEEWLDGEIDQCARCGHLHPAACPPELA